MIRYYLGWFNSYLTAPVKKQLNKDITKRSRIVFISAEPNNFEQMGIHERAWLDEARIHFEQYDVINYSVSKEKAHQLIQQADVIFLLGGYPIQQNDFLYAYDLRSPIRKSEAILIGASAGAFNLSKQWIASSNFGFEIDHPTMYNGIGIDSFSILSHFDLQNHLSTIREDLSKLSYVLPVYASNKDCAIRVDDEQITSSGEIYLIENGVFTMLEETF
jgi:cyanophycinase-like exopeptidase